MANLPDQAVTAIRSFTADDAVRIRALGGAVLALLAARATDRDEVTVFLPVYGASTADRVVPVAATVTNDSTGTDLFAEVLAAYEQALENPDAEEIGPTDLMLAVDGDVGDEDAHSHGCPLRLDLRWEHGTVELTYDDWLFSEATARRLADSFVELLDLVLKDPSQPLSVSRTANDVERGLIAGFNATTANFPEDRTLHSFLQERAATSPDVIALAEDGTTYGELNQAANRLARVLRARGVGAGEVVGVCIPRSPQMLVAVYAVLKAGGAYLPLDPTLPANRIDYILGNSGTTLVVVDDETAHVADGRRAIHLTDPAIAAADSADLAARSGPEDLAYVIYTSGSTGRPKGVMIEHRAIVNRLWWMQRAYPLGPDDVILHKTPFTFDVSVWEIFWWSFAGASVVTLPGGAERDPQQIATRIAEYGVTTMHFVPSMLHAFLLYTPPRRNRRHERNRRPFLTAAGVRQR